MTKEKIIKLVSLFKDGEDVPSAALNLAEGHMVYDCLKRTKTYFSWTSMKICRINHPVDGKQRILRLELYPVKKEHLLHLSDKSVIGQRLVVDINLESSPQWTSHEVITDLPPVTKASPINPSSIPPSNFQEAFSDDVRFGHRT